MQALLNVLLPILLFLTSLFLILLVLIQRGRGGGLAGAFGGLGGQSAFGTKAGDLFTRITIVVATFWILLCAASVKLLSDTGSSLLSPNLGGDQARQQAKEAAAPPAQPGGEKETATPPAGDKPTAKTPPADAPVKESPPGPGQ
jgi:preprotein translocase subunit SecG